MARVVLRVGDGDLLVGHGLLAGGRGGRGLLERVLEDACRGGAVSPSDSIAIAQLGGNFIARHGDIGKEQEHGELTLGPPGIRARRSVWHWAGIYSSSHVEYSGMRRQSRQMRIDQVAGLL